MIFSYLLNMQSHPSWVCGLKLSHINTLYRLIESHPSWVCGLKHRSISSKFSTKTSHPSWVCGLKLVITSNPRRI